MKNLKIVNKAKLFLGKYWGIIAIFITTSIAFIGIADIITSHIEQQRLREEEKEKLDYQLNIFRSESELKYDKYKCDLVEVVQSYIDSVAPTSALNGYTIVCLSEKYDLDIKFVLAQGQIESCFGTKGMASKTNSVFNVGAYDNASHEEIHSKFKYSHPDYSVEPYMVLLYKDYIVNNKTELDLMSKFVNKNGKRFSSNTHYEKDLLEMYSKIDNVTNITQLQGEMHRYKIICGK